MEKNSTERSFFLCHLFKGKENKKNQEEGQNIYRKNVDKGRHRHHTREGVVVASALRVADEECAVLVVRQQELLFRFNPLDLAKVPPARM